MATPTEVKSLSADRVSYFINEEGELVITNGTAKGNDMIIIPIKELTGMGSEEGLLKFYGGDHKLFREFETGSVPIAVAICRFFVLWKGRNNPGIDKLYVPKPRPAGSGGFRKKNKVPEDEVGDDDDTKEEDEDEEVETKKKPAKKPVAPRKPKSKAAPKKPAPVEEDDDNDEDDDDDSGDISDDLDSD